MRTAVAAPPAGLPVKIRAAAQSKRVVAAQNAALALQAYLEALDTIAADLPAAPAPEQIRLLQSLLAALPQPSDVGARPLLSMLQTAFEGPAGHAKKKKGGSGGDIALSASAFEELRGLEGEQRLDKEIDLVTDILEAFAEHKEARAAHLASKQLGAGLNRDSSRRPAIPQQRPRLRRATDRRNFWPVASCSWPCALAGVGRGLDGREHHRRARVARALCCGGRRPDLPADVSGAHARARLRRGRALASHAGVVQRRDGRAEPRLPRRVAGDRSCRAGDAADRAQHGAPPTRPLALSFESRRCARLHPCRLAPLQRCGSTLVPTRFQDGTRTALCSPAAGIVRAKRPRLIAPTGMRLLVTRP